MASGFQNYRIFPSAQMSSAFGRLNTNVEGSCRGLKVEGLENTNVHISY